MIEKFKAFVIKLNQYGIPLPMVRDPKSGTASVSLTLMIISFVITALGLVGKLSGKLDINLSEALTLFGVTSALYFGRNMSTNGSATNNTVNNDKQ